MQMLEQQKKLLGNICFLVNTILGIPALYATFYTFSVVPLLVFPIFGYSLLWVYWLEKTRTNKFSILRWGLSFLFNLGSFIFLYLEQANELLIPMFWTAAMCVVALYAIWLTYRCRAVATT